MVDSKIPSTWGEDNFDLGGERGIQILAGTFAKAIAVAMCSRSFRWGQLALLVWSLPSSSSRSPRHRQLVPLSLLGAILVTAVIPLSYASLNSKTLGPQLLFCHFFGKHCCCQAGMNENYVDDFSPQRAPAAPPFSVWRVHSMAFACVQIHCHNVSCLGILSFTVTTLKQKTGRVASTPHASVLNLRDTFVQLSNNDKGVAHIVVRKPDLITGAGWAGTYLKSRFMKVPDEGKFRTSDRTQTLPSLPN